ncbi:PREDICTED: aminopeptidase Q-like [Cyphomyrmex costatus]|uniref:aminopeptidase Q-like n=1 Tax=Cyphomyrmex costatus TaxID=456900 RepID=UPI00085237DB|nr:PREDICTED: aminopeptidase Q-like [Cyphomyrmex costatus]
MDTFTTTKYCRYVKRLWINMGFLKLLLNVSFILAMSFCINGNFEIIRRLPSNAIPFHYDIELTPTSYLEGNDSVFIGESDIRIEIHYPSQNISLHARDLLIDETVTTLTNDKNIVYKPMEHTHDNVTSILTLEFKNVLSPGFYTLNIKFTGILSETHIKENGFMKFPYTNEEGKKMWTIATFFEPNGARRVFPCWDEPAFKATFNISVKHHNKYSALSNMPVRIEYTVDANTVMTRFKTTLKMSTYLVAIVMVPNSDYIYISNAGNMNTWCRRSWMSQVEISLTIAKNAKPVFTEYFNSSDKMPKTDHVVIPHYPSLGMEHWGLIIYSEALLYNDNKHPRYKSTEVALLVSHEIIHYWFGNLVTPSWWTYQWLKEGLTMFIETTLLEKFWKGFKEDVQMFGFIQYSLFKDIGTMQSVTLKLNNNTLDHGTIFGSEVYIKAPVLLRMLYNTITAEVFRKGLITYLARYQFGVANSDDFWSSMQSALDESDVLHKDYKIKEVMDTWMNQDRYPIVNVIRNYTIGEVTISQICVQKFNETITNKWWIPLTYTTQSNLYFNNTVPKHWLRPDQNITFLINSKDWFIVNLQHTGYYRVNYDIKNWHKISNYLHSGRKYLNIHVFNRAQIINDAFFFMMEENKEMSGYLFINIISYLANERNYVPWYTFLRIVTRLLKILLLPDMFRIKLRMKELLGRLLIETGYEEEPNENHIITLIRANALKLACTLGDMKCKEIAATKLRKHLEDPKTHKIPQYQNFVYCPGLMTANRTIWDKMLEIYLKKDRKTDKFQKRLLKSLSCAENPDIIINYLNITAFTKSFPDKEHCLAFIYIIEKHARNDLILDHILTNFEILKPKLLTISAIITKILENIYSDEQIEKVQRFSMRIIDHLGLDTFWTIQESIKKHKNFIKKLMDTFKRRFHSTHPPYDTIDPEPE